MTRLNPCCRLILSCLPVFLVLASTSQLQAAGTLSVISRDIWVNVDKVYDGDTFRTKDGEKVRLLGINAPEVTHGTEPGQPFGREAKQALQQIIGGKIVRLKQDIEHRDMYGRLLAQVYLENGHWVNGDMTEGGYAFVYTFTPNLRWAPALLRLEKKARSKKLGIWNSSRFRMLSSKNIGRRHIGQFRLVEGRAANPAKNGFGFRLGRLHISIPRKYRAYFRTPAQPHAGQRVIVRGTIRSSAGKLYLALHSPFDLEIVE